MRPIPAFRKLSPWFWPLLAAEVGAVLIILAAHIQVLERGGLRFILIDDAMISMSYARSLAEGCGLVWYCGAERVEGFTNFLWTLYMALWHVMGISENYTSLPILLTGLVTLGLQIHKLYQIGELIGGEKVGIYAAWLGALWMSSWRWHVSGLETGFLVLILLWLVIWALRGHWGWWAWVLAGVGVLIRMDFALWAMAIAVWWSLWARKWVPLLWIGSGVIGAVIFLTAFRLLYYEAWVPNTYLVKVGLMPFHLRLINGFLMLLRAIFFNLPTVALLIISMIHLRHDLFRWIRLEKIRYDRALLLGCFLVGVLYHLYVGGDTWEYPWATSRFLFMSITAALPLIGIVTSQWLHGLRVLALLLHAWGMPTPSLKVEMMRFPSLMRFLANFCVQSIRERYNVFHASTLPAELRAKKVAVSIAGTYPYFNRSIHWIDILGLCSRIDSGYELDLCNEKFELNMALYHPGHTIYLWSRVLREADALASPPLACEEAQFPKWKARFCDALVHGQASKSLCMQFRRINHEGDPSYQLWLRIR